MNEYEVWLEANERFLAESISGLRERLLRLANDSGAKPSPPPEPARVGPRKSLGRAKWVRREVAVTAQATPLGGEADSGTVVSDPDAALPEDAAAAVDEPALTLLTRRLGLSTFERDVLLLAAAMELDTSTPALCARAQHDPGKPFPTYALAMALFEGPAWDVMSPERPLRHWRLLEVVADRREPMTSSRLRADDRIVSYLKGLNHLDERLHPLLRPLAPPDPSDMSESQLKSADDVVAAVHRSGAQFRGASVQLLGSDTAAKRLVGAHAGRELGVHLFELSSDDLSTDAADAALFVRLWGRECLLSPVGLYLDAADAERTGRSAAGIRRWLQDNPGVVLLDLRDPWPELSRGSEFIDVARPTRAEQHREWNTLLEGPDETAAGRLAGQFDFNLPTIRRIAANPADADGPGADRSRWQAALMEARPALDQLAQRLESKATWEDLRLPAADKDLLREIADQVAHRGEVYDNFGFRDKLTRGLGISVLFAGDSGTGKTMAAEVLANDLELSLYRIDLSAVVSKYIGETEKNLRALFDAAEGGGVILFFDEADALFGKRTEVKDSHDRYANIEINYLLQRMETFQGLAILGTNLRSGMDTAFVRRLRFVVSFVFPGIEERAAIWSAVFPRATPVRGLDYQRLARLNLTGGSIQNVALNAAFAAARSGSEVSMQVVLDAARTEFRKLDKPINEADFRWLERAEGTA